MSPPPPLPPDLVINNRRLGFLIWSSITSSLLYLLPSLFLPSPSLLLSFLSLLLFLLSALLLSLSLALLSSPSPSPSAPLSSLAAALFSSLLGGAAASPDLRRRARRTLASLLFLLVSAAAGFVSAVALCGKAEADGGTAVGVGIGIRGAVFGLMFGADYLYRQRWILRFPVVQRPFYYSFKMGLVSSVTHALKLSTLAFFCSSLLMIFLPDQFKSRSTMGQFLIRQIYFYIGSSAVSLCWELSHHLHQVVHTRRCIFAPLQGSAATEANPSEAVLEALEQSSPRSLLQYLAYLDLCMVSESNAEPWRRAAFFEETGETYRRVISVCLRPLEHLTSRLAQGLEGVPVDKSDLLAQQLSSSTDAQVDSKLHEALNDLQLYTWCARTVAALTARSHWEDRCGVAQLTGCNISVVSGLLSALLAVEACLGKKTNPQSTHLMGPASIRWATVNTGRRDVPTTIAPRKRGGALYSKAYAMADVLRTSIYQIVSAFETDMKANAKASVLEKNWITDEKPLYATRDILVQKLALFLEFRAN